MAELLFVRPRMLVLVLLLLLSAGFAAFESLGRREDPEIVQRYANITTRWPGASSARVEALVTERIEDELRDVAEIKYIESFSRPGVSLVFLELREQVSDVTEVWTRVRDRLDNVRTQLPDGVLAPRIDDREQGAMTLVLGLCWDAPGPVVPSLLRRYARELEQRARALPGCDHVLLRGLPREEVRVQYAAAALAAIGLQSAEVSARIAAADARTPAGRLRTDGFDLGVELRGEIDSVARVEAIELLRSPDGAVVRVGDVAEVRRGEETPSRDLAQVGEQRAVMVGVRMGGNERVDRFCARARSDLAAFAAELPDGLRLAWLFDQSRYTGVRLQSLFTNLIQGVLLVAAVLLLMMGWRAALVVSTALPLVALLVLAGLAWLGIPIHQISITGLILSLGLLIDNAIIAVEELRQRLRAGLPRREAVRQASRHLVVPLVGSTVTTVLTFLPIALLPGATGEFVGSLAISVMLSLTASLGFALWVVTAFAGHVLPLREAGQRWWQVGCSRAALLARYRTVLDAVLRRPLRTIGLSLLVPLFGAGTGLLLDEQFFPPAERDMFAIDLRLPTGTPIERTAAVAQAAQRLVAKAPGVQLTCFAAGDAPPRVYYNLFALEGGNSAFAQLLVTVDSSARATALMPKLQRELQQALPAAMVVVRQFEQGPPFEAPLELRLYGDDLDQLAALGEQVRGLMAQVPSVVATRQSLQLSAPKLWFRAEGDELRRAGFDERQLAAALDAQLIGAVGGALLEQSEELPVRVLADGLEQRSLQQLRSWRQRLPDGGYAPLSAFGQFELMPDAAAVPHRDGHRVTVVQGFLAAGVLPSVALVQFERQLAAAGLQPPAGWRFEFAGEQLKRNESVAGLTAWVPVIGIAMLAFLVATFQSFRLALLIGSVAAASVGFALLSLWLGGFPLGFMAIVGCMGLVGVAVNDAIVVLTALREDVAAMAGDAVAAREVVVRSTRHVLATTFTTAAGFLPLVLAGGGFWPPLAVAIAGGVGGTTLMALSMVPAAFLMMRRWQARRLDAVAAS